MGAGGVAAAHLPGLLRLGDVVVHSIDGAEDLVAAHRDRAAGAGAELTVAASLDDLLGVVDVVDVVVPTPAHAEVVRRAVDAGRPTVCEKPLARTDADADELVARAAAAGVPLFPAHVVRWFPAYARLRESVEDGTLGELAVLRFSRAGAYPTRVPWFADRAASGGIVMDQMIHDLDIARWVAGPVVRVSAVDVRSGTAAEPIEAAHVLLTHASGAISQVSGLWGPQHLAFSTEYSVTGTGGTLSWSSLDEADTRTDLARAESVDGFLPPVDPADDPYALELVDFFAAFSGGAAPRVSALDGAVAVHLANAALASLASGQPVEVSL